MSCFQLDSIVLICLFVTSSIGVQITSGHGWNSFDNSLEQHLHRLRRQEPVSALEPLESEGEGDSSLLQPVPFSVYSYREKPPPFHFAVYDESNKICILAKFDASFTITYDTKYGPQQMIDRLLSNPNVTGVCESYLDEKPIMDIRWRGGFVFRLIFKKDVFERTWKIEEIELLYNTADSIFRDAINGGTQLAKSKNLDLAAFETALDRSYFCPNTPALTLYNKKGEPTVLVRLFNVQVQAFKIKGAKFSTIQHCGQVGFGAGIASPFLTQTDDGVIVVTFSIYLFMSFLTVAGYAGYRTWFVKKYEYGTMA